MVVGHTIQEDGISGACGGRVLRVDVGMSTGCGNHETEVLEILDDKVVRRLRMDSKPEVISGRRDRIDDFHPDGPQQAVAADAA